jgi:hypothetical protein
MDSVVHNLTEDKLEKLGLAMGEAIMFKMEVAKQEHAAAGGGAASTSHGGAAQVSPVSADDELKQQQLRISQAESLKNEGYTRTIDILQRLDLHAHIPAFMSAPAATHATPRPPPARLR